MSSPSKIKSAVGVIVNEDGKVLITKRKVAPFLGFWVMPGGKSDKDESPQQTAVREVKEEVGIVGEITKQIAFKESLPSENNKFRHYEIYYYQIDVPSSVEVKPSIDEVEKYTWVGKNDYQEYKIAPRAKEVLDEIFH